MNKISKALLSFLWSALCIFIAGPLIAGLTNWSMVDPILAKFAPLKATIEPTQWPQLHDGQYWIRVNIRNDGLKTIKGLNADYLLACEMNESAKAELHQATLKKGESDYFEFAANVDPTCSPSTRPYLIQTYKDSSGRCYTNTSGNMTSNVCLYCNLTVNLYRHGFDRIKNITHPYPFNLGGVNLNVRNSDGCLNISEASDPKALTLIQSGYITFRDLCTGCIQGTITDKDWCKKYCSGVYD